MALDFSELMTAEPATALAAIRDRPFNCGMGAVSAQPCGLPTPFETVDPDVQPQLDVAAAEAASAAAPNLAQLPSQLPPQARVY